MDQPAFDKTAQRRHTRRRALLAILLASSLATLGAGAMTLAQFTDTKTATGSWTAGTVTLGVSPSTAFTATGILPGATDNQTIVVTNTGTGAMRYALSTSATDDGKGLAAQMTLLVQAGTCASPGATIYSGALGSAAFGSNAQGANAGDRTVAASSSESLCFTWEFPLASGNGFQSAATTATFTFDAEQTAHNP